MSINKSVKDGKRLRVVIAGGSIAGLTLAHCLHHNNIDFVVLEARKELAPQVGASIVVLPNGARILDQLGLYKDLASLTEPLLLGETWNPDGSKIFEADGPLLIRARTGYPSSFLQRQNLLKVLSDHIPDKSKIHVSKRVGNIDHSDAGIVVHCEDGSTFSGDIVVGADGVHSAVKPLMQNHIDRLTPGKTERDRNALSAEYNCIFGLGKPFPGTVPGQTHRTYANDLSTLSFVGEEGRMYWFLFTKLDKRYFGKEIPRYRDKDMETAVKRFFDVHMTESITFDKIWETRTFANMTCIEEWKNENWTADRYVCIGDSVHKMTPNLGAGGNAAIESAAALANSLAKLPNHTPSLQEIRNGLRAFYEKRQERANLTCDAANALTRLEAFSTWQNKLTALYLIPSLGDAIVDLTCDSMVGAELLDALPAPPQSLTATMPWNPDAGVGKHERKLVRVLWALPILLALYGARRTMGVTIENLQISDAGAGKLDLGNGVVVPLCLKYFGSAGFDAFLSRYVSFFTPLLGNFDPVARLLAFGFGADLVAIQAIWYIEGLRRGNMFTAAHLLPTIFGAMFQVRGLGFIAPIYCFLHYIQSPLENYAAADNRMLRIGPAKTIIPTIVISYLIPSITMMFAPSLATRQWINGVFWQPFPIYGAILQRILPLFVKDTANSDRVRNPEADMPYLRAAYRFSAALGAVAYLYLHIAAPVSLVKIFLSNIRSPSAALPLIGGAVKALRYDQITCFSATTLWTLLSFKDLKKAGKLQAGWGRVLGIFAGTTVVAGPGAALAVMWGWREEILAQRRDISKEKK